MLNIIELVVSDFSTVVNMKCKCCESVFSEETTNGFSETLMELQLCDDCYNDPRTFE